MSTDMAAVLDANPAPGDALLSTGDRASPPEDESDQPDRPASGDDTASPECAATTTGAPTESTTAEAATGSMAPTQTADASPEAAEDIAEAVTWVVEGASAQDAPVEERPVTPVPTADASADSAADAADTAPNADSPLGQIKVVSTATVRTLEDSPSEGSLPPPPPPPPSNGDVRAQPRRDRPRRAAAGRASSSITKIAAKDTVPSREAASRGETDDNPDINYVSLEVVAESAPAGKSQPALYGIVSPRYNQVTSEGVQPLTVRPAPSPSASATTSVVTASTAALSRQSKCITCNAVKTVKYMVMANGSTSGNVVCSDQCLEKCVSSFTTGRMTIMLDAAGVPTSSASTVSTTTVRLPPTPPARVLTVCQNAECGRPILPTAACSQQRTVWETQVFCSPACVVQQQKKGGKVCVFCKVELPEMVMGKYCVRFGADVRQFCTNLCLDGFKKRLKVCSYCQRDITRFQDSFLAPVGTSGSRQFKEFCSQTCLTCYKSSHSDASPDSLWQTCAVCLKNKPIGYRVAVKPNAPLKPLCSPLCLKAYKFAIKDEGELETCAMCNCLLVADNMANYRVWNGSSMAHLCSQSCSNVFVLSKRRIVSCRYCKVKKYNFDMMDVTAEKDGYYCSVRCLKNCGKRISPTTAPTKEVPSNFTSCKQCGAAIDSATPANASGPVSAFCGSRCAVANIKEKALHNKYVLIAPNTTSTPVQTGASNGLDSSVRTSAEVVAAPPMPLIQSVVSLADGGDEQQQQQEPHDQRRQRDAEERLRPEARHHPAVVLLPPAPVHMRNVGVQVRPCRPERPDPSRTASVATQTDAVDGGSPAVLPIPVPIPFYVPAPMAMYSCPYPVPVPLLLPVPVPLLYGAEDALRLLCGQPGGQDSRRASCQEASDRQSAANRRRRRRRRHSPDLDCDHSTDGVGGGGGRDSDPADLSGPSDSDSERDDQPPPRKRRRADDGTQSPPRVSTADAAADGRVDLAALMRAPPTTKRRPSNCSEDDKVSHNTEFLGPSDPSLACHHSAVKYTWCVRVFEQFVKRRNGQGSTDGADNGAASAPVSPPARPPPEERLVADPLQASPVQLAAALSVMARELRRPDGRPYPPDLVHYILLGVQLFLLENGRRDSLFWDEPYEQLAAALQERLRPAVDELRLAELDPGAYTVTTHIEERHLWEARVLGAHSPHALLTTVMFFVTKYFLLGNAKWHEQLSFGMIQESLALRDRLREASLKLLDSGDVYERKATYEMPANSEDPYRCPVKFVEFYISRCPESARAGCAGTKSALYLTPAADGRPDDAAWFSEAPLPTATIGRLLERLLTVREIQAALLFDTLS